MSRQIQLISVYQKGQNRIHAGASNSGARRTFTSNPRSSLTSAMTVTRTAPAGTLHRAPHARLCPNWQVPIGIPLILDIIRRPLKVPIGDSTTSRNLFLQTLPINAQFRVGEILPTHFKFV